MNRGLRGADWVADNRNVAIGDSRNVTIFDYEEDGVYQAHYLKNEDTGRAMLDRIKSAYSTMFEQHGAKVIFGLVPEDRRDVNLVARWTGARSHGLRLTEHGFCELFILTRPMWEKFS